MNHPTELAHYTLAALAAEIANLRYDALGDFVHRLSLELDKQCVADQSRGRALLARELYLASQKMADSADRVYAAWRIARPYELGERADPDPLKSCP